ncbi:hypothetical protein D3C77_712390 [compost metagenome]
MRSQVGNQPGALIGVQRDTFIVVVPQTPVKLQGMLADRQQPLLLCGYSDTRRGMGVHHAIDIRTRRMNR